MKNVYYLANWQPVKIQVDIISSIWLLDLLTKLALFVAVTRQCILELVSLRKRSDLLFCPLS